MNQVQLLGNVTKDVTLQESPGHHKYVQFVLAVNNRSNKEKSADFINLVAFGTQAENLSTYAQKGTKLAINGRLSSDSYTDKDGVQRRSTAVIVEQFEFVPTGNRQGKDAEVVAEA